uniref:Uncharacterized protein n=1 Tax=viral metagenome TaxID=1070528 RepID=A0A6C0BR13_9ZZZZ
MSKPSSFSTICTSNCAIELVGLLLSLSVFHPDETIYVLCDTKTKRIIDTMTPRPKLQIKWFIELDKYDGMNRQMMEQNGLFGNFLLNKMKIMKYVLRDYKDTLFLDSDIIIVNAIQDIDRTKQVGLSPQFIQKKHLDITGYYNAGLLWTNSIDICDYWESIINYTNHCPEQINMTQLRKYSYFEFGEEYNVQAWRMYLSTENKQTIANHITSSDTLYYKNKPLRFIHTHFHDARFKQFNECIIHHLSKSKMYKVLAIIYRVINNKWILKIPKQPMKGWGQHSNDSYRELPLLMKKQNTDLDVRYVNNTRHCWLEPNILTYDRDTLEWCNEEVPQCSLMLLGNGDIEKEGKYLKNKIPKLNIKPWIFWPRKPELLEKILKEITHMTFKERSNESIFIGNFENSVQEKFRTNTNWGDVVTEYHCTAGIKHKFTHEEYLMKLGHSRYGLCLRGYGSKCHREVELMAFGTIPIVTPDVNVNSYMDPLVENTHYILVTTPDKLIETIRKIDEEQWTKMSMNCREWYMRNVHSEHCWNNMIEHVLYD